MTTTTSTTPGTTAKATMKALVYQGPGKSAVLERPIPRVAAPTDAVVKVRKTTICGTDLHILKGDVPTCAPGRILGHEGIGIVAEVGAGVTEFHVGDPVIISCISACGKCENCRKGMYSHCASGGWILGNAIDGTQAEFVRIPHADTSLYRAAGRRRRGSARDAERHPAHRFRVRRAQRQGAAGRDGGDRRSRSDRARRAADRAILLPRRNHLVDLDDNRLAVAKKFGATSTVNSSDGKAAAKVMELTGGRGVDTAIEAVGIPATFELCQDIVAAGGRIANIGVHGEKVDLHLERLWAHNITLTTRLVDTVTTPMLLKSLLLEEDQREAADHAPLHVRPDRSKPTTPSVTPPRHTPSR